MLSGPFLGTEAVSAGLLRKHHLQSRHYISLFPGVYVSSSAAITFGDRVEAAWLWSRRQGIVAGLTAARMYGAQWVADTEPVELVWPNARRPRGIHTSAMNLQPGETVLLGHTPVTSLTRTAFDLARRPGLWKAVARLDALSATAPFDPAHVLAVAERHRGVRGLRQVPGALTLHDAGAQSPQETRLRLVIVHAGFPAPQTQIPVRSASGKLYYLDMGWPDLKIAVEYDGDQHRTDPEQFAKDILRHEELLALGWVVIRIVAGTSSAEILDRLRRAWPTPSALRPDRPFGVSDGLSAAPM